MAHEILSPVRFEVACRKILTLGSLGEICMSWSVLMVQVNDRSKVAETT